MQVLSRVREDHRENPDRRGGGSTAVRGYCRPPALKIPGLTKRPKTTVFWVSFLFRASKHKNRAGPGRGQARPATQGSSHKFAQRSGVVGGRLRARTLNLAGQPRPGATAQRSFSRIRGVFYAIDRDPLGLQRGRAWLDPSRKKKTQRGLGPPLFDRYDGTAESD